ncbi:NADH-quinone oxidoreductase subunit C [Thermodesulfobacteriota bacterium B35]
MNSPLATALARIGIDYRPRVPAVGLRCSLHILPEQIRSLARSLAGEGFFIETVTAEDMPEQNRMDGIYLFNHYEGDMRLLVRVTVSRSRPHLPSIGRIFPGAVWHERETAEMFGITFDGCPDSRNLLLPEEATFHPLRKDFTGV